MKWRTIEELSGKTVTKIDHTENEDGNEALVFILDNGTKVQMSHCQNCCESVYLNDIDGDLNDLVGSPIVEAEEAWKEASPSEVYAEGTWTYYKIGTVKGSVNLRWLGESNGYYSEDVDVQVIQ